MRPVVVLVMFVSLGGAAACGRVGFAPLEATGSDAGTDALTDALADALLDAAPCTGPLGAPVRLDAVSSSAHEWGGALSDDGLELFFGSTRAGGAGGSDLYVATRADRAAPFEAPVRLATLATAGDDDNPFLTADQLTLWFDRAGVIVTSVRAARGAPWQPAQPVAGLAAGASDVAASLSRDELTVYFSSDRPPSTAVDLWMATRAAPELAFSTPVRLDALSTAGFECCPQLTAGEDALMFTTNQLEPGVLTIGVVALAPGTGVPVGAPSVLTAAALPGEEVDVFTTRDGALLGFASRPLGAPVYDLYLSERACP